MWRPVLINEMALAVSLRDAFRVAWLSVMEVLLSVSAK
jgi:hypothetical protein